MRKNKSKLFSVFSYFFWVFFTATSAHAQSAQPPATLSDLNTVITSILAGALGVVGLISFAMLLFGGFKYMSAGSDKGATEVAKNTLTYAIAGLVIAASAIAILTLIGTFFGVNLGIFDICIETSTC
jgi:hypothetical protein